MARFNPSSSQDVLCSAHAASAYIGTEVMLGLYTEEYNGKDYLKIEEVRPLDDEQLPIEDEPKGVPDDIPF